MRGIGFRFPHPFYSGPGSTAEVPGRFDCALNGRGYMFDTEHELFKQGFRTIPLIRDQADTAVEPGESSVNREDLWPRGQTSWHMGAGQEYLDAADSDRARFWKSLGIDPWTRGKISLLPDTAKLVSSANNGLQVIRAGDRVYLADGNTVKFAQAPYSSFTDSVIQAGEGAQPVRSIASDGSHVYAALGSNGIHQTAIGASSSSHFNALQATLVAYVKDRLMAALGQSIYNVTASGSAPTALWTHPNAAWTWTAFGDGPRAIYAAGYVGDKSLIYRIGIKEDGTGLDVPIVANADGLPDGEIVRSICGYLGFVVIGTDNGFRLATTDTEGNLTVGALVKTDSPVLCFEAQERFLWFGWPDYDEFRTGLGRLDLSLFTQVLVPAYATDLMAGDESDAVQGAVTSVCTGPDGRRLFTVDGEGLFVESTSKVDSGYLDSGKISFGIPDRKIALRMAMKHEPLPDDSSISIAVSADDGDFVDTGTSESPNTSTPDPFRVPEMTGVLYQVRAVLSGDAVLERYDFRAYPISARGDLITIAIRMHELVETRSGDFHYDTAAEYRRIRELCGAQRLVSYKDMGLSFSVFVSQVGFEREFPTKDRQSWNGTILCELKALGD